MSIQLSVAIITLNEEKNIARCIESVKEIADEIVVVDSYSTDATEQICEQYGVKFIKQKFLGHVEQKNFAIDQTSNEWVLSLDADEALSEQLQKEVKTVKESPQTNAYQMPRMTNYLGKWIRHTDWYPDKKIRLFHRDLARWGGTNPHDSIILEEGTSLKNLKGDILHYSYYSIQQHLTQLNKFTDINAQEAFKKGKKATFVKIYLNPIWKFSYSYFFRLGILDGYKGFLVCSISSFATFAKYIKLKELYKK